MDGMIPSWYRRYFEWARSKSPRSRMVFIVSVVALTMVVAQILGQIYDSRILLRLFGWMMLILAPLAALDAWAAGILVGQRIAPWIRLFAISGVGIVGGLFILSNF